MSEDDGMECPECDGTGWIDYEDAQDEYQCRYCIADWLDKEGLEKLQADKAEWWLASKGISKEKVKDE